eukprot:jgi/Tetstr1/459467/TSEL_004834.t1
MREGGAPLGPGWRARTSEGGAPLPPTRGKHRWVYTASCFTCTAALWLVIRFAVSHHHLSVTWVEGVSVLGSAEPEPLGIHDIDASEEQPAREALPSIWPEPCLANLSKGEAVPVMDLVHAALKEAGSSSMFILQHHLANRSAWAGPGTLPKAGNKMHKTSLLPADDETIMQQWPVRRHCAAVGNSGHLKLSSFGKIIDSHDFVMRLNQAPTKGYERWVGQRTSVRFINYSWLTKYAEIIAEANRLRSWRLGARGRALLDIASTAAMKERLLRRQEQVVQRQRARAIGLSDSGQHADALKSAARSRGSAALQAGRAARFRGSPQVGQSSLVGQGMEVPLEQGVTLVFRWQTGNTMEDILASIRTIRKARPDVQVLIVSSAFRETMRTLMALYNRRLRCVKVKPEGGDVPSSGLMGIFMLMHLCKAVTLYGYGAAAAGGRRVPYHYYTNLGERSWSTKASIHSFNTEQKLVEGLAAAHKKITICNDKSGARCGAVDALPA